MNNKLTKLLIHGFFRRKNEIIRACIATLLAVYFISGILLFQENMYQWQMAENRKRFGDWFIIENFQQTNALDNNEYLTEAKTAGAYAMLYDNNWQSIGINIGYMTQEFMDYGNIRISEGKLPEKDNEIACDYNTLSKLGYSTAQLGQEITLHYYYNNNKSSVASPRRTVTYTLTGILENFTDAWSVTQYIPGALLTEDACDMLDANNDIVYMYGLKEKYRDADYNSIYEELSQYNSKKIYFNSDVYDFEPWGPKNIYNYIYLLVMVIGVAALTYQIIGYQHQRTQHYVKLYRLGTTKSTVFSSRSLENLLILLPSGLAGIILAVLTGRVIGWRLESLKGVSFFRVNMETIVKSITSLLLAFLVAEIVSLFMTYLSRQNSVGEHVSKRKLKKQMQHPVTDELQKTTKTRRCKLRKNNVTWQMNVRLSRSNGFMMRLGARIFSLGIALVIVFCTYNIYDAYQSYKEHISKADITGFAQQSGVTRNYMSLSYDLENSTIKGYMESSLEYYMMNKTSKLDLDEYLEYRNELAEQNSWDTTLQANGITSALIDIPLTDRYIKPGNTSIISGIDDTLQDVIDSTKGIKKLTYSAFETTRDWDWDSMDIAKMGVTKLDTSGAKVSGYSDTYLYATEYVDPTEELYERLSKYMDADMVDYDAFKNGDQIIVFTQKNVNNSYDETIEAGTQMKFHYYTLPVTPATAGLVGTADEIQEYINNSVFGEDWMDMIGLATGTWYEMGDKYPNTSDHTQTLVPTSAAKTDEFYSMYYKMMYEPCVSSQVAAVVQVTDEVEDDLSDILTDYGVYTAIASSELAKQECEKQNELIEYFFGEEGAEQFKCEYTCNQVTAYYDLEASYSATDNILSAYFSANNVIYRSSADANEIYRTEALNALLQYGITMIAAIVINILIYSILTKNRLEMRKHKLEMLARLGSNQSQICLICVIEVIRESLWCIFTAPLQILVQYLICKHTVRKL